MGRAVDFFASHDHFAAHLEPVMAALGADAGKVYRRTPPRSSNPIVVASGNDLATASNTRRTVALAEHGSGQSYGLRGHRSYAGGRGRGKVSLFLCPNERVAVLNREAYPRIPAVVVGSPRVDVLRGIPFYPLPASQPTVAIAFHWRCRVAPEAGTALDHYRSRLRRLRVDLAAEGVTLIGHGHPRAATELQRVYAKAGIEWVPRFEDVVARADAFVADNSSTLFEFAALDRPVVLLNSPRYRRDVEHGLRFWAEAGVGVQVDHPSELVGAVLAALADPPAQRAARRATTARVYPHPGIAARLAADALRSLT